jgi:hypothetical protein
MNEELIAPCGMNCALCISYQFGLKDLNKLGYHRKYCPGCIPRGKNCTFMKSSCDLIGKGKIRYCYECKDFPCKRLKDLDKRYTTKYNMSMINNLKSIKNNGINIFLKKEEDKWKCDSCKEFLCCHKGLCLTCNSDKI